MYWWRYVFPEFSCAIFEMRFLYLYTPTDMQKWGVLFDLYVRMFRHNFKTTYQKLTNEVSLDAS